MVFIFICLIAAFVVMMLAVSGGFSFQRKSGGMDTVAELRKILLARTEGTISQEEFERRQAALHLAVLDTSNPGVPSALRNLIWIIPVALVLLAVGLYFAQSKPTAVTPVAAVAATAAMPAMPVASGAPAPANAGGDMSTAVRHLEAKLQKDPKNGEGWLLLARSYNELGRHRDASDAYAKAIALLPADPKLVAEKNSQDVLAASGQK